jgi:hypothetical protein
MLDPARKKRDLHIRAAGIFLMQLELLEIRRLVALCHNKGANLDEDRILATYAPRHLYQSCRVAFAFAVVPQMQSGARPRHAGPAENHNKECAKYFFGWIHA